MKILILSVFPAPYRMAVFKGIAQEHDVKVFFERVQDRERHQSWFETQNEDSAFHVLCDCEGRDKYSKDVANIKKFDLVVCYDPFTEEARKLERVCIKNHIPYIINADGVLNINTNLLKKIVKSYYVKHAYKCFAGSESAVRYFRYYGAKEENIVRHHFTSVYASEILDFSLSTEEKARLKQQLGLKNVTTFITVGRFMYEKGFDVLLEAWKHVKGESQLVMIGGGTMRSEYDRIVAEGNMKNVIIYDYFPHETLMSFLKASDYFIMPTRGDVWGLVVNEAMSVGLPVISSDQCVSAIELVKSGVNGYIYEVNDHEKLALIINDLSMDTSRYDQMSVAALNAISPYTYENIIAGHLEVFSQLEK